MEPSPVWRCIRFAIHLAIVYAVVQFATPGLAGWTYHSLLPIFHVRTSSSSGFEFLFSNLAIFALAPAFLAGLLTFRFRDKSTAFVWVIPAAVLAYKIATYLPPSLLEAGRLPGLHYYLGNDFVISEFRSWREFWDIVESNPEMTRGMAQFRFTAPFYAGIGYSFATWICLRTSMDQKLIASLQRFEEERFGSRDKSSPVEKPQAPPGATNPVPGNSTDPHE